MRTLKSASSLKTPTMGNIVYFIVLLYITGIQSGPTINNEARLLKDLLDGHNKEVRPVQNDSLPITVLITFILTSIREVNEQSQYMRVYGILALTYRDDFLTWDPANYSGINKIAIDPTHLWKPGIGIYNSVEQFFDTDTTNGMKSMLTYDGYVSWMMGGIYSFTCNMNTVTFPFDSHICNMNISSATEDIGLLRLMPVTPVMSLDLYESNPQWSLEPINATTHQISPTGNDQYVYDVVSLTFSIARKTRYQVLNLVLPLCMTILLLPTLFLLPSDSGDKISVGITILLTLNIYQLALNEETPASSDYISYLNMFLIIQMGLAVASVMAATLVLRVHFNPSNKPPPQWARMIFLNCLARILCKGDMRRERKPNQVSVADISSPSHVSLKKEDPNKLKESPCHNFNDLVENKTEIFQSNEEEATIVYEWKKLALILDTFFFYLFFLVVIALTFTTVYLAIFKQSVHK